MKITFHLPNFVNMYLTQLNYSLICLLEESPELFQDGIAIGSVFDSFPIAWNGGRIVYGAMQPYMIEKMAPQIFKMFNDKGVACRLTFSNPLIAKEHLDDAVCNRVLDLADNGLNGVIVVSRELERHIRERHPNMPITSSTCKQLRSLESIEAELSQDYRLVVLDYNVNRDMQILSSISDPARCEILVNAVCNPECPRRGEHYRHIGQCQLALAAKSVQCRKCEDWKCENLKKDVFERRDSSTYLSPEDIYSRFVPMGYRNFKIEGRGTSYLDLAEQYSYFLAKPEFADLVRYKLLKDVISLYEARMPH